MAYKIVGAKTPPMNYKEVPVKEMLKLFADENHWANDGSFCKIQVIKEARIRFSMGLKDAKRLVEEFMEMVFVPHVVRGDMGFLDSILPNEAPSPH